MRVLDNPDYEISEQARSKIVAEMGERGIYWAARPEELAQGFETHGRAADLEILATLIDVAAQVASPSLTIAACQAMIQAAESIRAHALRYIERSEEE